MYHNIKTPDIKVYMRGNEPHVYKECIIIHVITWNYIFDLFALKEQGYSRQQEQHHIGFV